MKRLLKWDVPSLNLPRLWRRKTFKSPPLWTSLRFKIEGSLAIANLKLISICCKGLIHLLQRRLTTNKEALPSLLLYRSNNCKTWLQILFELNMVVHLKVLLCTQSRIQRGLTTYECLQVINLPSFNSLTEREIPNNTLPTLLKLVTMLAQKEIFLWNNLFVPFEGMPSIGTPILSLNPMTVRSKWKESF